MSKKRKHHETCPSCAFIHAHRLKYGKRRHDEAPFNHMVHSAIKISAIVLSKLDNKDKGKFIANLLAYTAHLEGMTAKVEGEEDSGSISITVPGAPPSGPTKH